MRILISFLLALSTYTQNCGGAASSSVEQALFDPAVSGTQDYAYNPAVLADGSMYYCGNRKAGQIIDHAVYRGPKGKERTALSPTPGGWDSKHICDPAVVRGQFKYNGTTYKWLMLYTGTADPLNNGSQNQVGAALSNDKLNWVKTGKPLIPFLSNKAWGVGQPSMTSVDGKGKVMVFYTRGEPAELGGTNLYAQYMDLSNIARPKVLQKEWRVGSGIHNADVMYDTWRDRFWLVSSGTYNSQEPHYVSTSVVVAWISGPDMWSGRSRITPHTTIVSTMAKTHNPAFMRTDYGTLPVRDTMNVYYTANGVAAFPDSLWAYGIFQRTLAL